MKAEVGQSTVDSNDTLTALVTCRLVLWSEKGELKKVVMMLITVSVT